MDFTDANNPAAGGTIRLLLNGTEGQQMFDNITVDSHGRVVLCEDVGNNAHLGRVWQYDPATDALTQLAQHDASRFVTGGANFLTQDEEASGVIDVTHILAMPARTSICSIRRLTSPSEVNSSKAASSS